jgi:hypothetical protein
VFGRAIGHLALRRQGNDVLVERPVAYEFGELAPEVSRRRTLQTFVMLIGLMLGVWLISFQLAVPLFVFVMLRLLARADWRITLAWPRSVLESVLTVSFRQILGARFRHILPL